mmetsp:Transcript_23864/g.64466  ORF Transcript_23864/g.64466 Transcript_23864/m.64466 type:complete len:262 (-) Transcript_23864:6-791(-)
MSSCIMAALSLMVFLNCGESCIALICAAKLGSCMSFLTSRMTSGSCICSIASAISAGFLAASASASTPSAAAAPPVLSLAPGRFMPKSFMPAALRARLRASWAPSAACSTFAALALAKKPSTWLLSISIFSGFAWRSANCSFTLAAASLKPFWLLNCFICAWNAGSSIILRASAMISGSFIDSITSASMAGSAVACRSPSKPVCTSAMARAAASFSACSFSLFLKRPHSTGAAHSTAAETTNLMKRMVAAGVGTRLEEAEC